MEPKSLEAEQCLLGLEIYLWSNIKWLANAYSRNAQLINAKIVLHFSFQSA